MAAVGSAVGLGNIWGFPYKLGKGGGFPFLLIYLILVVFVGFIVMLGELAIGRKTGKSSVFAYKALSKKYTWIGYLGVASGFIILAFYSVLGGYVMKYAWAFLVELFSGTAFANASGGEYFGAFMSQPGWGIFWFALFQGITVIIVMGGISGGIEKFSKIAMPALFFMLLAVIIKSLTLPGSGAGLAFLFAPDFSTMSSVSGFFSVLRSAAGQMFFSLSLGMGCMITYGSYLSKKENLESNAVIIPAADSIIALMAALAVMPAVFAFGLEPNAGPGLLFVTMQEVFMSMGGLVGSIFGFLFYFLVFLAAVTSSISLLEVCTSFVIDKNLQAGKPAARKKWSLIMGGIIFLVGMPIALDGLGMGWLGSGYLPFGWVWLDVYDLLSEGIMMPLGALLMSCIIGWVMKEKFSEAVTVEGNKFKSEKFFMFCAKFVTPIFMLFVLVTQVMSFLGF